MFTIKLYNGTPGQPGGYRQRIFTAESFSILRGEDGSGEITLHRRDGNDQRFDIDIPRPRPEGWPEVYERAIIENAAGKTTEIISASFGAPANTKPAIAA